MRLAVLHHSLTGYSDICLRALHAHGDVKIFLAHCTLDPNTPFDPSRFIWVDSRYEWKEQPDANQLIARLNEFKPDLLLTLGWHVPAYRRAARSLKGMARRILYFDTTWRGTPKQWLGIVASPVYVLPLAEFAWVPGSLQRDFARRLGFADSKIIDGYLSGDTHLFEKVRKRREQLAVKPKAFLFVGRMVKAKGVRVLLEGYAQYRSRCSDPWPLICVGSGPLAVDVASAPGVVMPGFLQPEQLAEKMLEAAVFVLPSLFEPWGVVVNEAASAGMPMIVSEAVGSHVHLVQSGFNGFVVEKGSSGSLANAMLRFHRMSDGSLIRMGKASEQLSEQYTPERWASTLRRIASDQNQ